MSKPFVQPAPAPSATTDSTCRMAVRRRGCEIQLMLTCDSEYAAIQLYDEIVTAAQRGHVRITARTNPDHGA